MGSLSGHTILFLKFDDRDSSKTWADYDTLDDALESLKTIHEKKLRIDRPKATEIVYDLKELCSFIDDLEDVGLMTFDEEIGGYLPKDRTWLKDNIQKYLKNKFRKSK
eukprot:CFRG2924T1